MGLSHMSKSWLNMKTINLNGPTGCLKNCKSKFINTQLVMFTLPQDFPFSHASYFVFVCASLCHLAFKLMEEDCMHLVFTYKNGEMF